MSVFRTTRENGCLVLLHGDRPISLDELVQTANAMFRRLAPRHAAMQKPQRISVEVITQAVETVTGVTLSEIASSGRVAEVLYARALWWYWCRRLTDKSYAELGEVVGAGHSTGIGAFRRAERWFGENKEPVVSWSSEIEREVGRIMEAGHAP